MSAALDSMRSCCLRQTMPHVFAASVEFIMRLLGYVRKHSFIQWSCDLRKLDVIDDKDQIITVVIGTSHNYTSNESLIGS